MHVSEKQANEILYVTPYRLTILWVVIVGVVQVLLCKFVFLEPGSGKFLLIKNRSVFSACVWCIH